MSRAAGSGCFLLNNNKAIANIPALHTVIARVHLIGCNVSISVLLFRAAQQLTTSCLSAMPPNSKATILVRPKQVLLRQQPWIVSIAPNIDQRLIELEQIDKRSNVLGPGSGEIFQSSRLVFFYSSRTAPEIGFFDITQYDRF